MGLKTTIDKVKTLVAGDTTFAGVYLGDQMAYSKYPVACVGAPPLLDENFPVIASMLVRDELHTVEIVIYVAYADTEANTAELLTLTDTLRTNLRADLDLTGYAFMGDGTGIQTSKFLLGSKGKQLLRYSVTSVAYRIRI